MTNPRWMIAMWFGVLSLAVGVCGAVALGAEPHERNWPQWRGPRATGEAPLADPPLHWDVQSNIRWKIKVPGEGSATPIVWDDRIFVLSALPTDRLADQAPEPHPDAKTSPPKNIYQFVVLCFDRQSGRELWRQVACEAVPHEGRHSTNSYASGSPVTDGERLYVSFGSRGLFCYDLSGQLLWKRELGKLRTRFGWGEGTSPTVYGNSLAIVCDQEENSFLTVLDVRSGETRWRADRDEPTSWATPLAVTHAGRTQLIVNGTRRARGYDLATGEVIWECGGQTVNAIPSPLADDRTVYCMSGYRGAAAFAIPLDAQGDLTDTDRVRWSFKQATPYVPSPILYQGQLYFTRENSSVLTALAADSGQVRFGPQRLPGLSSVYASPVAAAGRVYFVDRDGTTVVLRHGPQLEVLATNKLEEPMDASPVLVGTQLFLRGKDHLYCIEESKK